MSNEHSDKEVRERSLHQGNRIPGRDYGIYARLLDSAAQAKKDRIDPLLGDLPEGSVIASIGSGTGAVEELLAEAHHGVRVLAVDESHELLELAKKQPLIELVFDNALSLNKIPDHSVDVVLFNTVLHEINSIYGQRGVEQAFVAAHRICKPGGRIAIADMLMPIYQGNVRLRIDVNDGVNSVEEAMVDGFLDYSKLSTRALFDRFHKEFKGGNAFTYQIVTPDDGKEYFELPVRYAQEFILRKDYTANWRQEIKEEYLLDRQMIQRAMKKAGFDDSILEENDNEWIRDQRLRGKTPLFIVGQDSKKKEVEFATHFVAKAQKHGIAGDAKATIPTVDYQSALDTIVIDEEHRQIRVGSNRFDIESYIGEGKHKKVYRVMFQGKSLLLKVARADEKDVHNVFKSMTQAIDRQHVLREYGIRARKIVDFDRSGPPYRWLVQKELPVGSVYVSELIREGKLTEHDVRQAAEIINRFELGKQWQLDMNPFNWARVPDENGESHLEYTGSTVYAYDEKWSFPRLGLLQWTDPQYVPDGIVRTAKFPSKQVIDEFLKNLSNNTDEKVGWWRKYLAPAVLNV